jgi:uncharacterized protein (TIGR02145 family)
MSNEAMENEEKKEIDSTNSLQLQIAKYYGNDGILSSKEKKELEELRVAQNVPVERFENLIAIAKDEIKNFKKFDVVSYLLDREDKLKLYSDAERLSIRISRVERWISELRDIINPKEDEKVNKREILIEKMKKIMKWFDQELYVDTNVDVDNTKDSSEKDNLERLQDDIIADEIDDFMNDEKNLTWRSCYKQLLFKKIKNIDDAEDKFDDAVKEDIDNLLVIIENKRSDILKELNESREESKKYKDLKEIQYEDVEKILTFDEKQKKVWFGRLNKNNDKCLKEIFEEKVKDRTKAEGLDNSEKLDKIKIRIRQYSDIKKLFEKNGYKESKTEVDFQKHPIALFFYILIAMVCFYGIDAVFFKNLDMIHRFVASQRNLTDARDGKKYATVEINGIRWMASNLNHVLDSNTKESGLPKDGGCFYSWEEAVNACPNGWRLPTRAEWQGLIDYFGGDSAAAINLRSRALWDDDEKGVDSIGFSALPAGYYNVGNSARREEKTNASWWAFTMKNAQQAYVASIIASNAASNMANNGMKISEKDKGLDKHSIRCVKIDGDKVPYVSYPNKADGDDIVKKLRGTVDELKNGSELPIIHFSNGKTEPLYDSFDGIVLVEDSLPSIGAIIEAATTKKENEKKEKHVIFPKNANVELTRFYEPIYTRRDSVWKDSSLWREDSVKVSGEYTIVDLNMKQDSLCRIGYNVLNGEDSITVNVDWRNPCGMLKKGKKFLMDFYYNISQYRPCKNGCSEKSSLVYRFIKVDVHAE